MGYDSSIYLNKETDIIEVKQFLKILNYEEFEENYYFYNNNDSEEHFTGVTLNIIEENSEYLELHMRTTVWKTIYDNDYVNLTLKQISERFQGYFETEFGKNTIYEFDGIERKGAEVGCFTVFRNFNNNMTKPSVFLQFLEHEEMKNPVPIEIPILNEMNPVSIGINFTIPYLISVLEEYLRSTYIVLLKYSENKKDIFKSSRIISEDLFEVSEGFLSAEKIVARTISFQNINGINSAFKKISNDINLTNLLNSNKPENNYLERLENLIKFRHLIIHSNQTISYYSTNDLKNDISLIFDICDIFYENLIKIYNWNPEKY
ncbi:hypothetical protein [uncultured Aquimarina sp.]|uniref:hypothetical protein n=1 Tax=uncultured Aquimarina sp. TaxID=575652 RepID=UPI002604B928|nr:hypothetical protein [uncultured Aquimarina sp.]